MILSGWDLFRQSETNQSGRHGQVAAREPQVDLPAAAPAVGVAAVCAVCPTEACWPSFHRPGGVKSVMSIR